MRLVGTHPRPAAAQPRPRCRLNRVVQHHWTAYGASPGLRDGFDYGYDANSNRLWRANLTAQTLDKPFDEFYQYDSLNRLVDFQRGTLNAEHTAILGTPTKEQTWNLDSTGNWSQFTSADEGVSGHSNGNLADDGERLYAWDALNRLKVVRRKSDNAVIGEYTYDALGGGCGRW